jgi:molybdate transport system ATP-binding protein
VTLPSIAPAVGAGAVRAGARALGEFGATITFAGNIVGRTQTLPLAIYMALQGDVNVAIGLSLVLLAVSRVVRVVAMRDRWTSIPTSATIELRIGTLDLVADLTVGSGEVLAIIGPNGSGKSTLLRCLAGLQAADSGQVVVAGNVVDDAGADVFVLPEDRNVGVLFQDDLLFPHMDLLDNVAFGPRARGSSAREAATVADEWLERVGVGSHRHSRPREVSGGQAQRAALARALVTEPDLLLLDEPLSALDASTRVALRRELREHLRWFGGDTVLVTHDALDALALADRIVVLEEGRITQAGTLAEVAGTPRTPYAAELMATNLLTGIAHATTVTLTATPLPGGPVGPGGPDRPGEPVVELGPAASGVQHGPIESSAERELVAESPTQGVSLDPGPGASPSTVVVSEPHEGPVLVLIRPSSVTLHREPPEGSPRNRWPVEVVGFDPLGDRVRVRLAGPVSLTAEVTASAVEDLGLVVGVRLWCAVKATDVVVVDR